MAPNIAMGFATSLSLCSILLASLWLYRSRRRNRYQHVASKIPGPKAKSFLLGNLMDLLTGEVNDTAFSWHADYGNVVRIPAMLGSTYLLISDPKALQYIFHTSAYHFPKPHQERAISRLMFGDGLAGAEGSDHRRQRRVLLHGFSAPEMKALVPVFNHYANALCSLWKEEIFASNESSAVVDIPSNMSRATLDSIGEAAFDYRFDSLHNPNNPLAQSYINFMFEFAGTVSKEALLFMGISAKLPYQFLTHIIHRIKSNRIERVLENRDITVKVAEQLIKEKESALAAGVEKKDVLSLLVKANYTETQAGEPQMTQSEMVAQMRTIMFAGHETTSTTVSWCLLHLCQNPAIQSRLRQEIRDREAQLPGGEFTAQDFDSMPYLTAVTKEILRFSPAAPTMTRVVGSDEVIPLQYPLTLVTGEVLRELPVPKGQHLIASISGYNRNKDIFGEDADTFNPDRWLEGSAVHATTPLGAFSNLFTFSGGTRSCIGWRFALYEIQAFLVELIRNFEFTLTPEAENVRREFCGVMQPTIAGEREKGVQLPLRIRIAS